MTGESKLIPILREGVNVVKMILFKDLKSFLLKNHPNLAPTEINLLAGALLNGLFGTGPAEESFKACSEKNRAILDHELSALGENFPRLRIPVTDALRIQFLCDSLEGINSQGALIRAEASGLLLKERDLPLPNTFISLVKSLGVSYGILSPSSPEDRIQ
jgi:hypothetical protein